ncbi:ABC transporter ATP-binding protein [Aurantibacillus circumpalustris]|uniref:ABC transporter ATP-binding protein n=1 Tax=Aurantibacillus circumpalustris TaxID=3036359 RepID=UPI00295C223D|nr:ABC transporter ATP-binding protein [Aurantibacillus circumpalustris]
MSNTPIVEIDTLTKTFKGSLEAAVKGVSFTINKNEVFGLLGPNGAGKTTIISILCGLYSPTSGNVKIDGMSLDKNQAEIKQIIGVVPQDIALYPTLTAKENLDFYGAMYGLSGNNLKEKINIWLEKLGLTQAANRKIETFSGGMKRRVNLIASILHEPKILFLDEPTVGVDVQSRNVIIEHLKELNKQGTTIVYTSHHLDEAQYFCTQIAIIDYGKILTHGSPSELVQNTPGCTDLEDVFLSLTKRKLRD